MGARSPRGDHEDRFDLAEDRTEYAADRTALANERTSPAWIRTGLAAIAAGFGFARLLGDSLPVWAVQTMASILVLCGIVALGFSAWRYRSVGLRLRRAAIRGIPLSLILTVNALLILAALIGLFGLWFG